MKPRLDALLRQRELLREHTQWLDDEIAAERARMGASALPSAAPPAPLQTPTSSTAAAVIDPPEADVKGLHNEVRRGCLLYFLLAVAVLGGLIAFIYWKYGSEADKRLDPEPPPVVSPNAPTPASPR